MKRALKISLLCLLIFTGVAFAKTGKNKEYIRVLIVKEAEDLDVYIKGEYDIRALDNGVVLYEGKNLNAKISPSTAGIKINKEFKGGSLLIKPRRGYFYLNNRPLRGGLIVRKKNKKLYAINYIDLEDYVKGVLFHEVSHRWPVEALKAQAIATRTYALYNARINEDKDYDVSSDMYSQVYGGKDSEKYRTNKAVRLTEGLSLFYDGKIFPAYFHATCGGKTEDANELWDINLPCLKSVDCFFCAASPHFKWEKNIGLSQILDKLNAKGYNLKSLEDIQIIERNNSGRVKALSLTSGAGEAIIPGKDFRLIMGPKEIRSLNFNLEVNDKVVDFFGFGWGHGVGMCQWGAYFMSKRGYKYQRILQFYYPGAEIRKIKN